jgi:serine/threonine protein kinase
MILEGMLEYATDSALQAAPMPERLGKYEVLGHVATGGMAEIHLARAVGLMGFDRPVVIKRMLPQIAGSPALVGMFLDEARIAAVLHHPNIVQVYDIGRACGQNFFAMEFLHGKDVRQIVRAAHARGQRLPLEHALNIIIGVCAGLHYAHDKLDFDGRPLKIVHRDVSPQNVFVTFDGAVKVVDFGLANASRGRGARRLGSVKGKLRYRSPEQCLGAPLDRRSDIFAVAVMLWELTTGLRLRRGDSEIEVMRAIVERDAPTPRTVDADYPPELERIVMKGLRRDPAARYQTARELEHDLEAFVREHRVALSSDGLAAFVRGLYGEEMSRWLAAQRRGEPLAEHLAAAFRERTLGVSVRGRSEHQAAPVAECGVAAPFAVAVAHPAGRSSPLWVRHAALGLGLAALFAFGLSLLPH